MKLPTIVTVVALASGCGKPDGQTLAEAVLLLCTSDKEAGVDDVHPAERQAAKSRWIDARLKHPEVRAAFRQLSERSPRDREKALGELVASAKLDRCAALDGAGGMIPPDLPLPELDVAVTGVEPVDDEDDRVTVLAREDALEIEGTPVPRDDAKLEALTAGLVARRTSPASPPIARLLLHRDARYDLLIQLIQSMRRAGVRRFDLVARRGGEPVVVPLELPEASPAPAAPALGLVVSATPKNLVVFSLSGAEGSLQAPSLVTGGHTPTDLARVQASLDTIQARHPAERALILMMDPATPMQRVVELAATVRARPDGRPLLPDIRLSTGFQ